MVLFCRSLPPPPPSFLPGPRIQGVQCSLLGSGVFGDVPPSGLNRCLPEISLPVQKSLSEFSCGDTAPPVPRPAGSLKPPRKGRSFGCAGRQAWAGGGSQPLHVPSWEETPSSVGCRSWTLETEGEVLLGRLSRRDGGSGLVLRPGFPNLPLGNKWKSRSPQKPRSGCRVGNEHLFHSLYWLGA